MINNRRNDPTQWRSALGVMTVVLLTFTVVVLLGIRLDTDHDKHYKSSQKSVTARMRVLASSRAAANGSAVVHHLYRTLRYVHLDEQPSCRLTPLTGHPDATDGPACIEEILYEDPFCRFVLDNESVPDYVAVGTAQQQTARLEMLDMTENTCAGPTYAGDRCCGYDHPSPCRNACPPSRVARAHGAVDLVAGLEDTPALPILEGPVERNWTQGFYINGNGETHEFATRGAFDRLTLDWGTRRVRWSASYAGSSNETMCHNVFPQYTIITLPSPITDINTDESLTVDILFDTAAAVRVGPCVYCTMQVGNHTLCLDPNNVGISTVVRRVPLLTTTNTTGGCGHLRFINPNATFACTSNSCISSC